MQTHGDVFALIIHAIPPNECKPRLPFHKPLARVIQQHSAERDAGARMKPP